MNTYTTPAYIINTEDGELYICTECVDSYQAHDLTPTTYEFDPANDAFVSFCFNCDSQLLEV